MSILTVITPAPSTRLTTPEAVVGRMGEGDATSDALGLVVDVASDAIAGYCHDRVFGVETVMETFREVRHRGGLVLARRPVTAVLLVTEYGKTIDPTLYEFDPNAGLLWRLDVMGYRYHWFGRNIVVTYSGGWALPADSGRNLPFRYEEACILTCVAMLTSAGVDPTLRAVTNEGVGAYSFDRSGAGAIPATALSLLDGDALDVQIA